MDRGAAKLCVRPGQKSSNIAVVRKPAVGLAGVHSALMPAARITLPHFSV